MQIYLATSGLCLILRTKAISIRRIHQTIVKQILSWHKIQLLGMQISIRQQHNFAFTYRVFLNEVA
ncbi:hypothetical protein NQ318_000983 [Aromia moschata]|uniref:Uncharacterized protein n=1 Tax=Aromia moschata TaxID=1265417 RepID=A0AAV8ZF95_9CUCU|nr:hypothetical protein NQ318_000983 [Aromia moschata]